MALKRLVVGTCLQCGARAGVDVVDPRGPEHVALQRDARTGSFHRCGGDVDLDAERVTGAVQAWADAIHARGGDTSQLGMEFGLWGRPDLVDDF